MSGEDDLKRITVTAEQLTLELLTLRGGRIDAVHYHPETGLLALSCYTGSKRWLGLGLSRVGGIGWLPRAPRFRAGASHPVVAALRSRVEDHRLNDVRIDPVTGLIHIETGAGEGLHTLSVHPVHAGHLTLVDCHGVLKLQYPPESKSTEQTAHWLLDLDVASLAQRGATMVTRSDRYAVERVHVELIRAMRKRAEWLDRRFKAVQTDLARLDDVGRLQKLGRLLIAQGNAIARGATRAVLEDWEEGGTVEVTLDPAVPAKQQAETFFTKARRLQRGALFMRKRLNETAEIGMQLDELVQTVRALDLDSASVLATLETHTRMARTLGVVVESTAPAQRVTGTRAKTERLPYNLFRATNDRPVLVGRGGKDNDLLITRFARSHDLWLHVRGVPGSHVVVPVEKGHSCPSEVLVDAATLAVHFSESRDEAVCEVTWVERRHVRKPKGSAAGAVLFDHEKVITVRMERDRLERLLATGPTA